MTPDPAMAERVAFDLDSRNRDRQALTRDLFEKAREIVTVHSNGSALLFAADPSFNPGVVAWWPAA